jgi:hypothetical protein
MTCDGNVAFLGKIRKTMLQEEVLVFLGNFPILANLMLPPNPYTMIILNGNDYELNSA